MRVTQVGRAFAFSFDSLEEITIFNDWLDTVDLGHARIAIPTNRKLRRVLTKAPSILRATCVEGVELIRGRWLCQILGVER